MTTPIPNCPQEDKPIRERAWTDEQRWAAFRKYVAAENDVFMSTMSNDMPDHPTEQQLDALIDKAINATTGATP